MERVLRSLDPLLAATIAHNVEQTYAARAGEKPRFAQVPHHLFVRAAEEKEPVREWREPPVSVEMPHSEMPEWLLAERRKNDRERAARYRERKRLREETCGGD